MPLTKKGRKIMRAMKREYGSKRGASVFYASRNAGKIRGVDRSRRRTRSRTASRRRSRR